MKIWTNLKVRTQYTCVVKTYRIHAYSFSLYFTSGTSVSVRFDCPRSMNINLSPSAVESATVLHQIIIESNPTAYKKWIAKRDVNLIGYIWTNYTASDSDPYAPLSKHDVIEVLKQASKLYWKDETGGLTPEIHEKLILAAVNLTETDEKGLIPFQSLEEVLLKMLSRCYFSGYGYYVILCIAS